MLGKTLSNLCAVIFYLIRSARYDLIYGRPTLMARLSFASELHVPSLIRSKYVFNRK